jgi:hypothetical protein
VTVALTPWLDIGRKRSLHIMPHNPRRLMIATMIFQGWAYLFYAAILGSAFSWAHAQEHELDPYVGGWTVAFLQFCVFVGAAMPYTFAHILGTRRPRRPVSMDDGSN